MIANINSERLLGKSSGVDLTFLAQTFSSESDH